MCDKHKCSNNDGEIYNNFKHNLQELLHIKMFSWKLNI